MERQEMADLLVDSTTSKHISTIHTCGSRCVRPLHRHSTPQHWGCSVYLYEYLHSAYQVNQSNGHLKLYQALWRFLVIHDTVKQLCSDFGTKLEQMELHKAVKEQRNTLATILAHVNSTLTMLPRWERPENIWLEFCKGYWTPCWCKWVSFALHWGPLHMAEIMAKINARHLLSVPITQNRPRLTSRSNSGNATNPKVWCVSFTRNLHRR